MKQLLALLLAFSLATPAFAMVTPVFGTFDTSLPASANNNTYFPFDTGAGSTARTSNSSDANARELTPIPGTVSNLTVSLSAAPGAGSSYIITLFKNGASTGLTCTVANTNTSCSDTSDSISVVAQDTLTWFVGSTTNPVIVTPRISSTFTGTNANESPIMGTFLPSNSATNYSSPIGAGGTTVEASSSAVVPLNGTIDNLYVEQGGLPGVGKTMAYTLFKNGVATSLTCTVTNSATTCSDLTGAHAFSVSAADTISVQTVPSGTPTAQITHFGFRLKPTTDGESPLWQIRTSSMPSGTRYTTIFGTGNQNTTESTEITVAPTTFTLRSLYVVVDKTIPSGSWIWTDRKNSSSLALTCSISSPNVTCNDTTHLSDSFNANDTIGWQFQNAAGNFFNYMKVAAVAYIAPASTATVSHGSLMIFTNGVAKILNSLFIY